MFPLKAKKMSPHGRGETFYSEVLVMGFASMTYHHPQNVEARVVPAAVLIDEQGNLSYCTLNCLVIEPQTAEVEVLRKRLFEAGDLKIRAEAAELKQIARAMKAEAQLEMLQKKLEDIHLEACGFPKKS